MIYLIITENPKMIIKAESRVKAEKIKRKLKFDFPAILIEFYIAYPVSIETDKAIYKIKNKDSS